MTRSQVRVLDRAPKEKAPDPFPETGAWVWVLSHDCVEKDHEAPADDHREDDADAGDDRLPRFRQLVVPKTNPIFEPIQKSV